MKLYAKSAFAAFFLALTGGAHAAASSSQPEAGPQFESSDDEFFLPAALGSSYTPPRKSPSPVAAPSSQAYLLDAAQIIQDEPIASAPSINEMHLYTQNQSPIPLTGSSLNSSSCRAYLRELADRQDAQRSGMYPQFTHTAPKFTPTAPTMPQVQIPQDTAYSFLSGQAACGYASTAATSLLIGGAAGLGTYALYSLEGNRHTISSERLKRLAIGIGSSSAALAGLYLSASANKAINIINQTRDNLANNPAAFRRQVTQKMQPILDGRVAGVQGQINTATQRHNNTLSQLHSAIDRINTNYSNTLTLPDEIAELEKSIPFKTENYHEFSRRASELEARGARVLDVDRATAATKFDAQMKTAKEAYDNQFLYTGANVRHRPFAEFVPREIKNKCPISTSLASSTNGFDTFLAQIGFSTGRDEVINDYALEVATKRHAREITEAKKAALNAYNGLESTKGTIASKQRLLTELLEKHYNNRDLCDDLIAAQQADIKTAKDAHATVKANLEQVKTAAGQATQNDFDGIVNDLTTECNSENKSWYQGALAGGITATVAATAGLWYWFTH